MRADKAVRGGATNVGKELRSSPNSFAIANAACDRIRSNIDDMLKDVRASSERIDKTIREATEFCERLEKRND